jgi:hypothetical protein
VSYLYISAAVSQKIKTSYRSIDLDYIDSEATKDIDGRIIPDWGEGDIPIEMDGTPGVCGQ